LRGQIEGLAADVRELNGREDLLFQKVMEIEDKIYVLSSNARVSDLESCMMTEFDRRSLVLKKLDEERLASFVRMDQIEDCFNSASVV